VEIQEGIPQKHLGGRLRLEEKEECQRGRQVPVCLGRTIRGVKLCLRWGLSSQGRDGCGVATFVECGQLVQIFPVVSFSRSLSQGTISAEDSASFTFFSLYFRAF
jgi:hypothetical protein